MLKKECAIMYTYVYIDVYICRIFFTVMTKTPMTTICRCKNVDSNCNSVILIILKKHQFLLI